MRRRFVRRNTKILDSELGFDIRKQVMSYAERLLSFPYLVSQDFILEFIELTLPVKSHDDWKNYLFEQVHDKESEAIKSHDTHYRNQELQLFRLLDDNVLKVSKVQALRYLQDLFKKSLHDYKSVNDFNSDILKLQDAFGLDEESIEVMIFLFCKEHFSSLNDLFSQINMGDTVSLISKITGITINKVSSVIDSKSDLVMSGLIENDFRRNNQVDIEINPLISEYFFGLSDDFFDGRFISKDKTTCFTLDSFHQNKKNSETIEGLLKGDGFSSLLLYGVPGTGKTEYARTVASLSGKKVFFLNYDDTDFRGPCSFQLALQVASKLVSMQNGILIVDEADALFGKSNPFASLFGGRPSVDEKVKSWVNNFMDNVSCSTLWILNSVNKLHESTMRRFNYSVKFNDFDNQQRIALWHECLKISIFKDDVSDELIEKLAYEFPINAGGIDMSLKGAEKIFIKKDYKKKSLEPVLRNFLEKQLVLSGRRRGNSLKRITENYDLSVLNLDVNVEDLMSSLHNFSDFLEEGDLFARSSFKMLFWGRPGTGKTEFAKYLAKKINRELIVKRASDLISMYVGQTEKNIASAFRQAEEKNAVLFIDEIDTFLASRENAHRSFEINQVNEFLTQLENFRGIFVGCSNLLKKLDFASLRRFDWKIEFKELTVPGRETLFKTFFKVDLSIEQAKKLASIKGLVPGDFNVVKQKSLFRNKGKLNPDKSLEELAMEAKYREGDKVGIGF